MSERYDVDNPPAEEPRTLFGKVISSDYINSEAEADAIEAGMGDRFSKFNENFIRDNNVPNPENWLVRVASNIVNTETGQALVFSQLVRTVNKKGKPLAAGQAPSILATQYRQVSGGLRASPNAVGQDDSLVGKDIWFEFEETEVALGRGYSKSFRLWPTRVVPAEEVTQQDWTPDNSAADSEVVSSYSNGVAPNLAPEVAEAAIVAALTGKTPGDMLGVVLGNESLKGISSVFGVDLMEAATDESLATILVSKGKMKLSDGILVGA